MSDQSQRLTRYYIHTKQLLQDFALLIEALPFLMFCGILILAQKIQKYLGGAK